MKTAKKLLSVFLSLMLALGAMAVGSVPAAAARTSFEKIFRNLSAELPTGTVNYFKVKTVPGDNDTVETVYLKTVKEPGGLTVYESSDLQSIKSGDITAVSGNFEGSWAYDAGAGSETWTVQFTDVSRFSSIKSSYRYNAEWMIDPALLRINGVYAINDGEIKQSSGSGWSIEVNDDAVTLTLDDITLNSGDNLIASDYIDLTIKGSGNLTSTGNDCISFYGGSLTLDGDFTIGSSSRGINVTGDLIIEGGSLDINAVKEAVHCLSGSMTVSGGSVEAKTESDSNFAIRADSLTVSGGSVTAENSSFDAISAPDSLTVSGGSVTSESNSGHAINTDTLTVSGGSVTAVSNSNQTIRADYLTVSGGSVTAESSSEDAIYTTFSQTVSGGSVTAESNSDYAISANGSLTVSGGSVTAVSTSEEAIYAYKSITFSGGSVRAETGSGSYAISANGPLTVSGGSVYAKTASGSHAIAAGVITLSNGEYYALGNNGDKEVLITGLRGNGTVESPYEISTYAGLKEFSSIVNGTNVVIAQNTGAHAKLTADIVCKNNPEDTEYSADWTPIGNPDNAYTGFFNGKYDGVSCKITGLTTPGDYGDYAGLFGYIGEGAKILDVGLEEGKITGKNYVGGVAGYSEGGLGSCSNTGDVFGEDYVGGVAGRSNNVIIGCSNTGDVSGKENVGGVAGYANTTFSACSNTGEVSGNENVGGVAGYSEGELDHCSNTGDVFGEDYVGGVAGRSNNLIVGCYNTGDVSGKENVGGVAGRSNNMIAGCYNTGDVSGKENVGGVAGESNNLIVGCYNTGDVSGSNDVGGVVGFSSNNSEIYNCYNSGDVSGENIAGGVVGENNGPKLECCYNTGSVTADGDYCIIGGVAGLNDSTITNCYNTGAVTADGALCHLGGVAGDLIYGIIKNCYNMGVVTAKNNSCFYAGVVGNVRNGSIVCSYYDKTVCGDIGEVNGIYTSGLSDGAKGLTTSQMTGADALSDDNIKFVFSESESNPWLVKDNNCKNDFYPHLTGFAYNTAQTAENWPPKTDTGTGGHKYGETGDDRFTCTVCGQVDNDLKAAAELADAKEAAKTTLENYKDASDYRPAQQTELSNAIAAGKQAIDNATDTAGVESALTNAKAVIDNIKTDAQLTADELALEKASAKLELNNYKNAEDYRPAQQTELSNAIAAGEQSIDNATDTDGVTAALADAKEAIDDIKTDDELTAEELDAAKTAAKQELDEYKNSDDYRPDEQAELENAIEAGKQAIDNAADTDGVAAALADAKDTIDDIKTDDELTAEEQLADAKEAAKQELDEYKDSADYRPDQQAELENAVEEGKQAIDNATDTAGVAAALADAKEAIDDIKTDDELTAEELDAAKTAAKQELDEYKNSDDYRPDERTELENAIEAGKQAIDNATDTAGVTAALADAKDTIDDIKTDDELTAEELAADKETFDEYKEDKKDEIDALAREGDSEATKALIDKAKDEIDALKYDEDKPLGENEAAADAIISKLKDDLAERRKEYTAKFIADGKTVAEIPYTVETKSIEAPAVPEKEGYTGEWEDYKLAVGGITVNAIYTENEEPVDDNLCKWCGKEHDNSFFGRLTKFFHNILLLLRWLFGNIDIRIVVNI